MGRSMLRWLLMALPLIGSISPALARVAQLDHPAIERVDEIRQKLLELDRSSDPFRNEQTAQWFNFPNWPNWGNWGNWPNWGNFWRNW